MICLAKPLPESDEFEFERCEYHRCGFAPEVELQYNRARWYDPTVGQWLNENAIGFYGILES